MPYVITEQGDLGLGVYEYLNINEQPVIEKEEDKDDKEKEKK